MQTDSDEPKPTSFWDKQFSGPPTPGQITFDFLCGILLPIACMTFDQGIFRPNCAGAGVLAAYANYFYTAVWIEMIVLMLWIVFCNDIKYGLEVIAGVFFIGIPLALIPIISLIPPNGGLTLWLLCLGVGEFFPLIIAFVYLRNGVRALRRARRNNPSHPTRQLLVVLASMLIFTFALPALVGWQTPGFVPIYVQSSTLFGAMCQQSSNE